MAESDKCKDDTSFEGLSVEELKKKFLEMKTASAITAKSAIVNIEEKAEAGKRKIREK